MLEKMDDSTATRRVYDCEVAERCLQSGPRRIWMTFDLQCINVKMVNMFCDNACCLE